MAMNNTSVESYLRDGCGRCEKFQTPECKVHLWAKPLVALRALLNATELVEEMKWGSPTYSVDGKNVVMLTSFKEFCALSFFKGAAMKDDEGLLEAPGPNSHHARFLKFQSAADVKRLGPAARRFIAQGIELERAGVKVAKPTVAALPAELEARLAKDASLKKAFEALTPGRQRSHVLHISGAKQAETRERRVDACAKVILAGRGFNERD